MWLSCGRNTSKRPAMLICVDSRAPLVPIGSLMTCTSSDWPSNTCFSMGTIGPPLRWSRSGGVALGREPGVNGETMSATCRKAVRSRPMSMKADCMPGSTRETLPR
ncbi:hypothetical protein FQZ97_1136820 [compost metagenome]